MAPPQFAAPTDPVDREPGLPGSAANPECPGDAIRDQGGEPPNCTGKGGEDPDPPWVTRPSPHLGGQPSQAGCPGGQHYLLCSPPTADHTTDSS